ncbi:MAG: hypothetical protein PVS3B1_35390 [Ktedonobacteraceae bacterium]
MHGPSQPTSDHDAGWKQGVPPPPPPYGVNPYEPTQPSWYRPPPLPQPPLPVPHYVPSHPPQLPQPLVQPRKRSNKLFLIISGVLVVVLALCGVSAYFISAALHPGGVVVTPTVQPSPTANSLAQNPYPPQTGTLVMNDPMRDNSKGYKWDEATMNSGNGSASCGFKLGNYHLSKVAGGSVICNPEAPRMTLANVAFEVNVRVIQGSEVGLLVRFNQIKGVGYVFSVTTDGRYVIDTMDLNNRDSNKHFTLLHGGSNAVIKRGLNQSNLFAIVTNGSSISVFINNQFVDTVQDASFASGQIGTYAYGDNGLDVVLQNSRVWRI